MGSASASGKSVRSTWFDYAVIALVAIAVALLVQAFVVKPFRIPSPSMVPALQPGDRVLVNRVVYHLRDVQHGDIVVFRYPLNTKVAFIKRVVGLPGDVLEVRDGRLVRNGAAVDEPYVRRAAGGGPVPTEPAPTMGDSTMREPWSLAEPYTVPPDNYFVMGDNRADSEDSRVWGPVPADNLIGEAFVIYWPPDRAGGM